jgi:DNA-directed RNA polymerase subunit alpha
VLGNSLRRILLSSIPGAAVTQIKIEGVLHEFSTIPGVKEDVTDIVLNVKRLVLRSYSPQPVTMSIDVKGPKEVRVSDIKRPADVEILNPDLLIATLNKDGHLQMEMVVERGKGYVSVERRPKEKMPIGTIPIDALFSPVLKVSYSVENTRVGQITDYDRLILEVTTDGSITPLEAVSTAAKIVAQHMELFKDLSAEAPIDVGFPSEEMASRSDLDTPIEELDLSTRPYNCLKREKIDTVSKLVAYSEVDLVNLKNFGTRSISEVKNKLRERGLSLKEE